MDDLKPAVAISVYYWLSSRGGLMVILKKHVGVVVGLAAWVVSLWLIVGGCTGSDSGGVDTPTAVARVTVSTGAAVATPDATATSDVVVATDVPAPTASATALTTASLPAATATFGPMDRSGRTAVPPSPTLTATLSPSSVATVVVASATATRVPEATGEPSPTRQTPLPTPTATATMTMTSLATVTPTSLVTPTSTPTPQAIVEVEKVVEVLWVATVTVEREAPDDDQASVAGESVLYAAVTTIDESEIEELQASRSRINRFRSNPVPIGEVLTVSNWSTRLVAVERTERGTGSDCRAPAGQVCLRIGFEIANLWDLDGDRSVYNNEFEVVGERGFGYGEGGWRHGDCSTRCEPVRLNYGERTTIEIYRFVPADERGLVLVFDEDYGQQAFWLESDPASHTRTDEVTVATPGAIEVGAVGTWMGNPVPVGETVTVDAYAVRVVEVERGWQPDADCCAFALPSVLLTSDSNEYVAAVNRQELDRRRQSDYEEVEELQVDTELVRVRFEATNVDSYDRKTLIDAANFVLVDGDRRVYTGGFYPNAEADFKWPGSTLFHFGVSFPNQQGYRQAEVYGGVTVSEEITWLIPTDATGLTLVYLPFKYEAGGFLALGDTKPGPPLRDFIDESLPLNGTWPSRPAPLWTGATYTDGVVVRVAAIEQSSVACAVYDEAIEGKECLRVTLGFEFEVGVGRRSIFDTDEVAFVVDGETVTVQRQHSENSYAPIYPRFDSLLDWAEIGGLGEARATYSAEVPSGWRNGMLVYSPYYNTPAVYLSINEPEREVAEGLDGDLRAAVLATVSAVSDTGELGLFEYLDENGFEAEDGNDLALGYSIRLMTTCVAYVARPTDQSAGDVVASVLFLVGASRVGELAPAYFESPDDAAVTCGKAFPASSKKMVLTIMLGLAQIGCLYGGQGAFGATPSGAMELGESMFGYWGEDSPVMMSDFAGPTEFCGWIFDGENAALLQLIDGVDLAIFE